MADGCGVGPEAGMPIISCLAHRTMPESLTTVVVLQSVLIPSRFRPSAFLPHTHDQPYYLRSSRGQLYLQAEVLSFKLVSDWCQCLYLYVYISLSISLSFSSLFFRVTSLHIPLQHHSGVPCSSMFLRMFLNTVLVGILRFQ